VSEANALRVPRGVVLRFGQFLAADASHVLDRVRTAKRGWSPMLGPPEGYSTWVDVDDAAAAVVAAVERAPSGTWNVAEDDPATKAEQAAALAKAVGRDKLRTVPSSLLRLGGGRTDIFRRSQRVSNRRFKAATGWAPVMRTSTDGWRAVEHA
jgi:nucleoside-diphosphate-sugar epimerase